MSQLLVCVKVIDTQGYGVRSAGSKEAEALDILEQHATEIALILSDLVMPELGGQALFHTLQERVWRVPMVMIAAGHPMERDLRALQAQGLAGWMLKPSTVEDLASTLAQALQNRSS